MYTVIFTHMYTHTHTHTERERERESAQLEVWMLLVPGRLLSKLGAKGTVETSS